ncbi:hypothetical protein ACSMDF_20270 [Yersinia enterocolitica]
MNERTWIDIKTKRDVRLFIWMEGNNIAIENYRQSKDAKIYNQNHIYGEDSDLAALSINEAFRILYKESDELSSYAYRFKKAKEALLPSKEFSWFKRCNDACYFTWLFVRVMSNRNRHLTNTIDPQTFIVHARTAYYYLVNNHYPENHRERIECIEDFFDRFPHDLSAKLSIMSNIRNEWNRQYHLVNDLPFKKSDKKKIDWAWDYIHKDKLNILIGSVKRAQEKCVKEDQFLPALPLDIFSLGINNYFHHPHFLSLFRPSTTTEKYLALRCVYTCLYFQDTKFIPRLKKAWESSNYRKTKRLQPQIRKKTMLSPESNELDNLDIIGDVLPAMPTPPVVKSHHEKTLLEAIKEKLVENKTITVENNEEGKVDDKDEPTIHWNISPY